MAERSEKSFRAIVSQCITRRNNAPLGTTPDPLKFDVPLPFINYAEGASGVSSRLASPLLTRSAPVVGRPCTATEGRPLTQCRAEAAVYAWWKAGRRGRQTPGRRVLPTEGGCWTKLSLHWREPVSLLPLEEPMGQTSARRQTLGWVLPSSGAWVSPWWAQRERTDQMHLWSGP